MKKRINIPKAFTIFLIISFCMWLLIKMSKEYETVLKYPVVYTELGQDKVFQQQPIQEIELALKGSGFKLLYANFFRKKIAFSLNNLNKKTKNEFYILPYTQKISVQKRISKGLILQDILQDTIFLNLGMLKTKKVPVNLNSDIKYALGYNVAGEIQVNPDSISVSGTDLQLSKISSLSSENLVLKNVSEDIKTTLNILLPENLTTIKLSAKQINVNIAVDKFTEGEFEVPITIINNDSGKKLNIYPKTVKVNFKVGLKHFNEVQSDSFQVVCDYHHTQKNDLTFLIPKLRKCPKNVSFVRITPNKIDFLIHKE